MPGCKDCGENVFCYGVLRAASCISMGVDHELIAAREGQRSREEDTDAQHPIVE
jgi:hypothetical protein